MAESLLVLPETCFLNHFTYRKIYSKNYTRTYIHFWGINHYIYVDKRGILFIAKLQTESPQRTPELYRPLLSVAPLN